MAIKSFYVSEEKKVDEDDLLECQLSTSAALDRVEIIFDHFGSDSVTLLTSFGVQSGVMLALGRWARRIDLETDTLFLSN